VFYAVDWREARAQKQAAEAAAEEAQSLAPGKTTWFLGIWGFEFYAERAGMRPLVLGRSQLHKGDYVVMYDDYFRCQKQLQHLHDAPLEAVKQVQVEDALPLRTLVFYYYGATPLRCQEGPRVTAIIYRVTADFVPSPPEEPAGQ
jgi:hypothetical protein